MAGHFKWWCVPATSSRVDRLIELVLLILEQVNRCDLTRLRW